MAYTLENLVTNNIIITNLDSVNPMLYTIYKLNDSLAFEAVDGFPDDPTESLGALDAITIDLEDDGIYKLIIEASPDDTTAYFLLDTNIKSCERELTKAVLCTCNDGCSDPCGKVAYTVKVYKLLKFKTIKNALYFEWNKWVQTQSVTDLITPTSNQLLSMSEWLEQLTNICSSCSDDNSCDDCTGATSSGSCGCGCS